METELYRAKTSDCHTSPTKETEMDIEDHESDPETPPAASSNSCSQLCYELKQLSKYFQSRMRIK